jgi:hypothetical protein
MKMMMPNIGDIMAYENNEMTEREEIDFFQSLINSGLVWKLQGHYGRTATDFIEAGMCFPSDAGK